MTPLQIARQEDIRYTRCFFCPYKEKSVPWVKIMTGVAVFVAAEFALASWLILGIGNGNIW